MRDCRIRRPFKSQRCNFKNWVFGPGWGALCFPAGKRAQKNAPPVNGEAFRKLVLRGSVLASAGIASIASVYLDRFAFFDEEGDLND